MIIQFTLASRSRALLKLVGEFAEGLECRVRCSERRRTPTFGRGYLRTLGARTFSSTSLSYVALSSVKLGLDVSEPQCRHAVPRTEGGGGC